MDTIFYWKKKYFKKEFSATKSKFYSKYPPIHSIRPGETMWVVAKHNTRYVLVYRFVVHHTTTESSPEHGDFCIVADKNRTVCYKPDGLNQKNFRPLLAKLKNWVDEELGVYFEGARHICELTPHQHQEIEQFSKLLEPY